MLITRKSVVTGITRTLDLPVTEAQMLMYMCGTVTVQRAFPNLTDSQREFIMTGMTQDEWDEYMSDEDDGTIPD